MMYVCCSICWIRRTPQIKSTVPCIRYLAALGQYSFLTQLEVSKMTQQNMIKLTNSSRLQRQYLRSKLFYYVCLSFVLSVCLSVCLCVCEQDYCKSNQLISLKLGIMIGPINRKKFLTFGGDRVPDGIPDHFFTSITIAEQGLWKLGILGDLLAFFIVTG